MFLESVRRSLSIIIMLWSAIYISHLLDYMNIIIAPFQEQAIFLGLILTLTFLSYPARKGLTGIKWYDWLFIAAGLVPNAYVVVFYNQWQIHGGMGIKTYEIVLCGLLVLSLLEGLRRALGKILPILLILFILHPLLSDHLPGILFGRDYSFSRVGGQFFFPPMGLFGLPLNIAATIVVSFLFFGAILIASGGGDTIMNITLSVVGRVRGGGAKAAVVASGSFGTLSGSVSANCAATGTFTIPMMKSTGYRSEFAGGVEAAASNGGQLMPPVMGAVAFIMAELLDMPYFKIALSAFIPAILYYICMLVQVDLEAASHGLLGLPASDIPSFKKSVKSGWFLFIPVFLLMYLIFAVKFSPELAAFWSALAFLPFMAFRKNRRLQFIKAIDQIAESGKAIVVVGLTCAMAGIMIGSVSLTGVALTISGDMVNLAGGHLFLLLLLAAIIGFIFGMGMGAIPSYIFVVLMLAPALVKVGVKELSAHLFVFWVAMGSFITPPVCVAAFVAAAIAKCPPMRCGFFATRVGIGIFVVPFAFVYNPALLLDGKLIDIAIAVLFCLIGIVSIAIGLEGFLLSKASWFQRLLFFAFGVSMFAPKMFIRLISILFLVLLVLFHFQMAKKRMDWKTSIAES